MSSVVGSLANPLGMIPFESSILPQDNVSYDPSARMKMVGTEKGMKIENTIPYDLGYAFKVGIFLLLLMPIPQK